MRLGRRWQEVVDGRPVNVEGTRNHSVLKFHDFVGEVVGLQKEVQEALENGAQGLVFQVCHADDVVVAGEAWSNVVPPPPWLSHRAHKEAVHHVAEYPLPSGVVVPTPVVHVLAEKLNGRLSTLLLHLGHVQVVNKNDNLLPDRRAVEPLPTLVQLRINHVLRRVRGSTGGEGHQDGRGILFQG